MDYKLRIARFLIFVLLLFGSMFDAAYEFLPIDLGRLALSCSGIVYYLFMKNKEIDVSKLNEKEKQYYKNYIQSQINEDDLSGDIYIKPKYNWKVLGMLVVPPILSVIYDLFRFYR